MSSECDPHSTYFEYGSDSIGRCIIVTDPRGTSVVYHYDANDRLKKVDYGSGYYVQYDYDEVGNLQYEYVYRAGNQALVTKYEYDDASRLVKKTVGYGTLNYETDYDYDDANNMTTITVKKGAGDSVTVYGYDNWNRVTSIEDGEQHTTHYVLDAVGNKVQETIPISDTSSIVNTFASAELRLYRGCQRILRPVYRLV